MEEIHPEFIYHYTTIEALFNMLKNTKTNLSIHQNSDTNSMTNDDIFVLEFHATDAFLFEDDYENKLLSNKFYSKNNTKYKTHEDIANSLRGIPYVISFCLSPDNLLMWKNYAKNNTGVCLKFNTEKTQEALKNKNSLIDEIAIGKCNYYTKSEIEDKANSYLNKLANINDNEDAGNIVRLIESLLKDNIFIKDNSYLYEDEFRIVLWAHSQHEIKIKDQGLISYKKISIPISCIEQVIIGDKADKHAEYMINEMFRAFNINKISNQKIEITRMDTYHKH